MKNPYKPGQKIKFLDRVIPYTVRACNERYAICTRKIWDFTIYTIVDFDLQYRGKEDTSEKYSFESIDECTKLLDRISSGQSKISMVGRVKLKIKTK